MKTQKFDIGIGVVLAVLMWGLYMFTLPGGAVPGLSASLILNALGIHPQFIPGAPYWHALAAGLGRISGSHAVFMLNAFSSLCAAVSVGLLYALMRGAVLLYLDPYAVRANRARVASMLSGIVAATGLGFSAPFWSVANRAHMMSFDIMLLLFAGWLLLAFVRSGVMLYAIVLTLLYGFMAAEFTTMIVVAPMFALGMLYALWRHGVLMPRRLIILSLCLLLGIGAGYALGAFLFFRGSGYAFREFGGFGDLFWSIWLSQARQISRSLPREGWLIILFTTTVPWLAMFTVAKRGLNDDRDKALLLLHVIMTVFACALWLHVPLTPWRLLGWQRLLITPYVLVAMVSGYLAGFWFLFAGRWQDVRENGRWSIVRFGSGYVLTMLLVGMTILAPWWFVGEAQPRGVSVARKISEDVVNSLAGRRWLVSDGVLDAHYYLHAWEHDIPLRVLSASAGNQLVYQRYVASWFDEVRLQNAALLSMQALLQEWLSDPDWVNEVAVLHDPDSWRRVGYEAVPQKMVYIGLEPGSLLISETHAQAGQDFLQHMRDRYFDLSYDDSAAEQIVSWGIRHAGRLGNDLGVLLEDQGEYDKAHAVYDAVLQLDPDNISSLLNLYAMVSEERISDPDGEIAYRLAVFEEELTERLRIWSLVRTYGIVRAPEAFAEMGWGWAYSGQARVAVADVERAVALVGDSRSPAMEALMAEVYMLDGRAVESASIYRRMLEDPEQRARGLAGLYRLALQQRQIGEARDLLSQLVDAGMPADRAVLEEIMLDLLDGQAEAALARLDDFLIENRDLLRGWVLMAEAGFLLEEERVINRALRRIEMIEGGRGYYGSLIRARLSFEQNDFMQAADFYEAALIHRPGHPPIVEELLRLNLLMQRRDAAQRHMRALLHADPAHALALYVRGSLQIADGDYRLAEDSLRRSLESERLPMALNDLAWVLVQRESYEEAEALIREALEMDETQAVAWSSLGNILIRQDRLDEAEAALSRSISLDPSRPIVQLYQAELQILRGRSDAAREILDELEDQRGRMGDEALTLWRQLDERIR